MKNIEPQNPETLPQLISPKHLAEILDIPVDTIYKWRQLNKGPRSVKIGERLIRYRIADVEKWLEILNIEPQTIAQRMLLLRRHS
ncbi:MAG: helix-turn-helix domain-containing protein [Sedimentisphaerales bacterium]